MITEIWKSVKGYEGLYEISNFGRVKSLARMCNYQFGERSIPERILKGAKDERGYRFVVLCRNGKRKTIKIHRLVTTMFIPNPKNKPDVNHKDGVKFNNFVENLEWCTQKENVQHAFNTGLRNTDYCEKKVAQILDGVILKIWKSQAEVHRCLKINQGCISACCRGVRKSAHGFKWEFA